MDYIEFFKGKKIVAVDAECLRDVKPPFSFQASEYLGNAVTCSLTNDGEYRDWVESRTMTNFFSYLNSFDYVVGYNTLNFDYPLWGGEVKTPEHLAARKLFQTALKGKTIDLCLDFHKAVGQRVGLNSVSVPTLGDMKEMEGGFAPQLWREGKCMEVIQYCRGDVRRTMDLFMLVVNGQKLKHKKKDGNVIEFSSNIEIR